MSSENIGHVARRVDDFRGETRLLQEQRSQQLLAIQSAMDKVQRQIKNIQQDRNRTSVSSAELGALTSEVSGLSIDSRNIAKEFAILRLLDYDQRRARHELISAAHERTFRWIFSPSPEPGIHRARFTRWLKASDGPFWISGKPGSGKSTLMKFIAGSDMLRAALREWARPKEVVLARHYFWSVGTPVQKSQEGLMRSLLSDIFGQAPDLISTICHKEWSMPLAKLQRQHWSPDQLRSLLQSIASTPELPVSFCFLIDGLDEYRGDHLEICKTLLDLSRSPHIKLCVSSRPWNVFEDHFGSDPATKLYVHELTREDIREYASSRLSGHYRRDVSNLEGENLYSLAEKITNMSQGVFLWVFLVVRTIREGLTNDDSVADLHRRLESFPTDLELFFKQLLSSVDEFYHEKMAGALRLALAAERPLKPILYFYQDLEFEDDQYALKEPVRALDDDELASITRTTCRRLNGRCKGLLEIHNGLVQFLHRTVKDFLGTVDMTQFLAQKTKPGFDPMLSLLRAQVATIKRTRYSGDIEYFRPLFWSQNSPLNSALTEALECAGLCDGLAETEDLLDDLEGASKKILRRDQILSSKKALVLPRALLFREHVLLLNLHNYLSKKLSSEPQNYLGNLQRYAYIIAFNSQRSMALLDGAEVDRRRVHTLKCLFTHGCDPNKSDGGSHLPSIWEGLVAHPMLCSSALKLGTLSVFLQHGADVNAMIPSARPGSGPVPVWFGFILTAFQDTSPFLNSVRYMQVLRQMFRSGPHLDWLSAEVPMAREGGGLAGTPAGLLANCIRESKSNEEQSGFLAGIIAELARCSGERVFWDVPILPAVQHAFSTKQGNMILEIISSRRCAAEGAAAVESRKRKMAASSAGETREPDSRKRVSS